jgi:phage-related protein
MKSNAMMFVCAAIVSMVVVFIFLGAIGATPRAYAYAVGVVPPPAGAMPGTSTGTDNVAGSSYDIGGSFQNLISPFTGFINNLKWNNNATINTNDTAGTTWPVINFTPIVGSAFRNLLSQWFGKFDNWFYGVTGIQLSRILIAILNVFSWALGLAQQAVNWLLGLFR